MWCTSSFMQIRSSLSHSGDRRVYQHRPGRRTPRALAWSRPHCAKSNLAHGLPGHQNTGSSAWATARELNASLQVPSYDHAKHTLLDLGRRAGTADFRTRIKADSFAGLVREGSLSAMLGAALGSHGANMDMASKTRRLPNAVRGYVCHFACSMLAGVVAAAVTSPVDLAKSRIMSQPLDPESLGRVCLVFCNAVSAWSLGHGVARCTQTPWTVGGKLQVPKALEPYSEASTCSG